MADETAPLRVSLAGDWGWVLGIVAYLAGLSLVMLAIFAGAGIMPAEQEQTCIADVRARAEIRRDSHPDGMLTEREIARLTRRLDQC